MQGELQMIRKALQLDQPVGLALRCALAQWQTARDSKHFAEISRQHAHRLA